MGGFVCFVALATATLCACSSLPQALAVSLQWMQTEPNGPFIARDQASAALIDGGQAALLIGGSDAAANALADVWRFHPNGTSWEKVTDTAKFGPLRMSGAVTARVNGVETTVLVGGFAGDNTGNAVSDVWATKDRGETWINVAESPGWRARYLHGLAAVRNTRGGDTIVMCGGASSTFINEADCWSSSDGGARWTQTTSGGEFGARRSHQMASSGGTLVLTGGFKAAPAGQYPSSLYLNDVWSSTDLGATWTQLTASAPFRSRGAFAMLQWPTGDIALFGGYQWIDSGRYVLPTGWLSSDAGKTWESYTPQYAPWNGRQGLVAVPTMDGGVTIIGGTSGLYSRSEVHNDAWHGVPN